MQNNLAMTEEMVSDMRSFYGSDVIKTSDIPAYANHLFALSKLDDPGKFYPMVRDSLKRVKKGTYMLELVDGTVVPKVEKVEIPDKTEVAQAVSNVVTLKQELEQVKKPISIGAESVHYPEVDSEFVPFGVFRDILAIFKSNIYTPVMVSGDSGNGKTYSVLQAAAKCKRGVVIASINKLTDEDSLIGGYRLQNGNTVYQKGPVRIAAETGSILLLDELDRGDAENLICLNALLDGYPIIDSKTGETIVPKEGFMIVATANTKGQGDDTNRFVSSQILDEAFLERFPITLEQSYPTQAIETKILLKHTDNQELVDALVKWAATTRDTYNAGAIGNFITTRRLVFILEKNYKIFGNAVKAVELGVKRFSPVERDSFLELFRSIYSEDKAPVLKTAGTESDEEDLF